jgi:hypothetical protein
MATWHISCPADTPSNVTLQIKFSSAHALHTPGHDDIRIATLDEHGSHTDGIKAAGTSSVNRQARDFDRPAGLEERHASNIDIFTALVVLSHDDHAYFTSIELCLLEYLIENQGTQFIGTDTPESAPEVPHRRPNTTYNNHVFHFLFSTSFRYSHRPLVTPRRDSFEPQRTLRQDVFSGESVRGRFSRRLRPAAIKMPERLRAFDLVASHHQIKNDSLSAISASLR